MHFTINVSRVALLIPTTAMSRPRETEPSGARSRDLPVAVSFVDIWATQAYTISQLGFLTFGVIKQPDRQRTGRITQHCGALLQTQFQWKINIMSVYL
jgi:hypothetical protein